MLLADILNVNKAGRYSCPQQFSRKHSEPINWSTGNKGITENFVFPCSSPFCFLPSIVPFRIYSLEKEGLSWVAHQLIAYLTSTCSTGNESFTRNLIKPVILRFLVDPYFVWSLTTSAIFVCAGSRDTIIVSIASFPIIFHETRIQSKSRFQR